MAKKKAAQADVQKKLKDKLKRIAELNTELDQLKNDTTSLLESFAEERFEDGQVVVLNGRAYRLAREKRGPGNVKWSAVDLYAENLDL